MLFLAAFTTVFLSFYLLHNGKYSCPIFLIFVLTDIGLAQAGIIFSRSVLIIFLNIAQFDYNAFKFGGCGRSLLNLWRF